MRKFQTLLNLRLKQKKPDQNKMTALAEKTTSGNLSSFSGVFRITKLTNLEKESIQTILHHFREEEDYNVEEDLKNLTTITSEVKAITNQAIILHGERIKKAQIILKNYQEGAFTAWLIAVYGNRQTPYNFLQYYEFYNSIPTSLQPKVDQMPRQAIYTLASRAGLTEKKEEIIEQYSGEPKQELLSIIRKAFPLAETDKRLPNFANQSLSFLKKTEKCLSEPLFRPSEKQKKQMVKILEKLLSSLKRNDLS